MEQDKAHTETDERLQSLEKEALNEALNRMSFDELLRRRTALLFPQTEGEPLLNEETRRAQIDRLLAQTREPSAAEGEPVPPRRRRTARRLAVLAAAVVLLVAALAVAAVASRREFRILGGSVRFENGHAVVRFPKPDDAPELTLSELETALREHGFDGVYLPGFFFDGTWGAEHFNCRSDDDVDWASFDLVSGDKTVNLAIWSKWVFSEGDTHLPRAQGIRTIEDGAQHIYLIDQGEGTFELVCLMEQYQYSYYAALPEETMLEIAASVSKREAARPDSPGQKEAGAMTAQELEERLLQEGIDNVLLPRCFYEDNWDVTDVQFRKNGLLLVSAKVTNNKDEYYVDIRSGTNLLREYAFPTAESITTIQSGKTPVYLINYGVDKWEIVYYNDNNRTFIKAHTTRENMTRIANAVAEREAEVDPIEKLKHDLAEHGFRDLRLPEALFDGTWQVKDVHFPDEKAGFVKQATFRLLDRNGNLIGGHVSPAPISGETKAHSLESAETVQTESVPVYLLTYESGVAQLIYFSGGVEYSFSGKATFEDMKRIAESVP